MPVKIASLALALLFASMAHADTTTQTWDVTASCYQQNQFSPPCFDPANINAVLTTTMESGTFYNSVQDVTFTGTEPVITGFSGTFDGQPIASVGGWLLNGYPVGGIGIEVGGVDYSLWWDGIFFLEPQGSLNPEYLNWTAVDPAPEPPLFWMLLIGLCLIPLSRRVGTANR